MGTRSKTTIFNEEGKPLVSIYRQMDGYFEGHGDELASFLKGMAVVNGYGGGTPEKAANGMGCLAAQIIAHLKDGIGGIYITEHDNEQEFNYEVRLVKVKGASAAGGIFGNVFNRVSLTGEGHGERKTFSLYPPTILKRVMFVYDKRDGEQAKWRNLDVTAETRTYLEGLEDGKTFKRFLKSKILEGRVLPQS